MQICYKLGLIALVLFVSCKKTEDELPTPKKPQKTTVIIAEAAIDSNRVKETSKDDSAGIQKQILKKTFKNDGTVAAVLKSIIGKPQTFQIPAGKDNTIICAEKTKISISANSFIQKRTGKPVDGKLQIKVQEYYKMSAILLAGLSTSTNGKLLETGGMLYITATSGTEECVLKSGATIGIEMPCTTLKPGMELYIGNSTQNKTVNWNLDEKAINGNEIYADSKVDVKAQPIGGVEKFYRFISDNFQKSDDEKSGTILVSFVVERDGRVTNPKIIKSLSVENDSEALRLMKLLPKFTPAEKNGIPVRTIYSIPIKITAAKNQEFDEITNDSISHGPQKPRSRAERLVEKEQTYFFRTTSLGWINCDRLWRENDAPKIDFAVFVPERGTIANLVFHKYKAIVNESVFDGKASFNAIPSGEKVTVVAIRAIKNDLYLAMKETNTTVKIENTLNFIHVSPDELKTELAKLDNLN